MKWHITSIIVGVFLGLHLLLIFWRPNPLWGIDFLYYFSGHVWVLFCLLSILLFFPGIRCRLRSWMNSIPLTFWGSGHRVWIARGCLIAIALVAFIAISAANHLLGDGYLLLGLLETGEFSERLDRAALTYSLIGTMHRLSSAWWNSAETTFRIISYLSGVAYLLLSFSVAEALGKNHQEKSIILAFLLTGGYLQLFAGYVEIYPLYLPATLLYILVGQRTLENRIPIYFPALLLGLLTSLHLYFVVFAPSLLFLAWRNRQKFSSSWEHVLVTFGALITAPLSCLFFLWVIEVDIPPYLGRTGRATFSSSLFCS